MHNQQSSPLGNTIPLSFHVMVKPRGAICNLSCEYCFYRQKEELYPTGSFRMSDEVLESFTRQYIQTQQVPEVYFAWQGGEPTLMGLEFFRKAVEFQKKYTRPGLHIQNSFQTNGILLDDAWCDFFKANDFLVGLSMDGPAEVHDTYRRDHAGNPTHAKVARAAELLHNHQVEFNILCCLHSASAGKALEIYRYFRDEVKTEFIQFIPIIEKEHSGRSSGTVRVSSRSIKPDQFGTFMIEVFDEWIRHDVGRIFIQLFDTALAAWAGYPPGLCIFEPTCGKAMALEHNGDLYSCDHFVDQEHFFGNILDTPLKELVSCKKQIRFGNQKLFTLSPLCKKCDVRFICNGECPKNRILGLSLSKDKYNHNYPKNYLCEGYQAFFHHTDQSFKIMASLLQQSRPAAEIMDILIETDGQTQISPFTQINRRRH